MRTLRLTHAAIALMAANTGTDGGGDTNKPAEANPAPPNEPTAPTAEVKYYLAKAELRTGMTATETTPAKIEFVVADIDYKTAWQQGRAVTRFGIEQFKAQNPGKTAWTDKTRTAELTISPGVYTVKSLDSLQERRKDKAPITVDNLLEAATAQGVKVPKAVADLIQNLKDNPAGAIESAGEGGAQVEEQKTGT